ncbi:hypothetical protein L861_02065 [Litchfieldella anticariensis FP35 = DSM 16096]|uniref:ADP-heptose--LPS heptosyltransferase n=1 Tax=Litchfieldella anticariensis (strain DSM 16096 / CECT 5854 / CIP 108499 / LMG 22089 / FP35) TaxID=1121939 RepID=S2KU71_LITA3|nr:glycosyltransferase family 9 protein [Halomonas anticariensis]EPC04118.1 hypothetical protein L861_02065 [Halomonas anticariensis FP35 = DSM 16096]
MKKFLKHPIRYARVALEEIYYDYDPQPWQPGAVNVAVLYVPKRIGDAMAVFPVIRALQGGTRHLIVVTSRHNDGVFSPLVAEGDITTIMIRDERNVSNHKAVAREISDLYGTIDLCVEGTTRNDTRTRAFVGTLKARSNLHISKSRMRCFSSICRQAQKLHREFAPYPTCWALLMRDAGIANVPGNYEIPIEASVDADVCQALGDIGPYIALNMDGSKAARSLTLDQAQEICGYIEETYGLPIVAVCSPAGEKKANALADRVNKARRLDVPMSIHHSAAIVKHSALVVTPDTSVLHMASAFDRPVLALFAKRQDRWRPLSPQRETLISGDHLKDLDMQAVREALARLANLSTPSSAFPKAALDH